MKRSNWDDGPSSSMNPPKTARSTSPHTISDAHSSNSSHTISDAHSSNSSHTISDDTHSSACSHNTGVGVGDQNTEVITPPFPWATDRPAMVHSLNYLLDNDIVTITGKLQCTVCNCDYDKHVGLRNAVKDLCTFIKKEDASMDDKAPEVWMNPQFQRCHWCRKQDAILLPLIEGTDARNINWLFLFLTQTLACCDLQLLNNFLKHNRITIFNGQDKQRVLYATYMTLYKQILPDDSLLRLI